MAGGEGTRLRPLTSNQPKPMMPLANRPMMEHIVDLLQRHGFDEIVVTWPSWPTPSAPTSATAPSSACGWSYATEETPLGTAGSVRNAMDELDERFLVISGDVLTDIDLGKVVAFHEEQGGAGHHRARRRSRTRSSSASSSPARTAPSSASSRSRAGARCSATRSTPASSCSSRRSSTTSPPTARSTSRARCSRRCSTPACRCTAPWPTATGRTSARSRRTSAPTRTSSTGKVDVDIPGFEVSDGVWLGEGAEIHPDAVIEGPAVIGDNCRVEAGARLGEYTVLGANVRVRADADLERVRRPRQRLPRARACGCAGTVVGRACDLRRGRPLRGGRRSSATSASSARTPSSAPGVKVYPFKTVEAGAVVNTSIVWESRGARSLFGRRRCGRAGQRRHHARARRPRWPWPSARR